MSVLHPKTIGGRILAVVGVIIAVLFLLSIGSWLWYKLNPAEIVEPPPAPIPLLTRPIPDGPGAELIRRGRYLTIAGDCVSCHTRAGGRPFEGGLGLKTPFGVIYSPNLTSDRETGIGTWTPDQFFHALRTGQAPGKHLYPAFPYPHFTIVSRADADEIFAYLKTIRPLHYQEPANRLPFPLDVRLGMIGWNTIEFEPHAFHPDPQRSASWTLVVELLFAVAEAFPVAAAPPPPEVDADADEEVLYLTPRPDPDREALSEALDLRSPAHRLIEALTDDGGRREGWTLTTGTSLGERSARDSDWKFDRVIGQPGKPPLYRFTGASRPDLSYELYLVPEDAVGRDAQLRRRLKALGALRTHAELLKVLTRPARELQRSHDAPLPEAALAGLDDSRRRGRGCARSWFSSRRARYATLAPERTAAPALPRGCATSRAWSCGRPTLCSPQPTPPTSNGSSMSAVSSTGP